MTPKSAPTALNAEERAADAGNQPDPAEQPQTPSRAATHCTPKQEPAEDMSASAASDSLTGSTGPTLDPVSTNLIMLKLVQFFLHEALQAVKGWGAMTSPLPQVRPSLHQMLF